MFSRRARSNKEKTKGKKEKYGRRYKHFFCITVVTALESTEFYILTVVLFLLLVISLLLVTGLGGKETVRCISIFNYLNATELQNQQLNVLRVQF